MMNLENSELDDDWENFLELGSLKTVKPNLLKKDFIIPKGTELYISTKTKIMYLSHPINLYETFWKLPILEFHKPMEGIVKKQMKFNFIDEDSLELVHEKTKNLLNVDEQIISEIKDPDGRIKFKDIRKISIGLCDKDIISHRSKKKSAFYNCFVIILRIFQNDVFKEVHLKIFNTGKIEIPGIRCNDLLKKVIDVIIKIFIPITEIGDLSFDLSKTETVLINSNFNCGFYINREELFEILKYDYKINCLYDPCSYPGIQCKYYYNGRKISFMIFRTGSVLIVGKCEDNVIYEVYEIVKNILRKEYSRIIISNIEHVINKKKKIKQKKRFILIG